MARCGGLAEAVLRRGSLVRGVVVVGDGGQPVSGLEQCGCGRKLGLILVGPATVTLASAITFLKASSRAMRCSFSNASGETLDQAVSGSDDGGTMRRTPREAFVLEQDFGCGD